MQDRPDDFDARQHATDVREFIRKEADRTHGHYREIVDAMPGDKRDEIEFKSRGPHVEVTVRHGMRIPPDRYDVCFQDGDGRVYASRGRGNLADEDNVYLKTTAVAGVTFCLRLYTKQDRTGAIGQPSRAEQFLGEV